MPSGTRPVSKRVSGDLSKVGRPPEGQPWTWLTSELLSSCAWRSQSINCRRLIEFLLIEHMAHAGTENGRLLATYDQLVAWGIGRRFVHQAIAQAEQLRLLEVTRGGRKKFAETHLTRFRLTFLPDRNIDAITGNVYYGAPTNEWRAVKSANHGYKGELSQCTKVNSDSVPLCTVAPAQTAKNSQTPTVHKGEPPSISRVPPVDERRSGVQPSASAAPLSPHTDDDDGTLKTMNDALANMININKPRGAKRKAIS
jgi:hypothetical protein